MSCAKAPSVSAKRIAGGGRYFAAEFQSGHLSLGTNLILPGDFSAPNATFSVFYHARVVNYTLLYARDSNWLLGTWDDSMRQLGTLTDRAYCDQSLGDGGWLASGKDAVDPTAWVTWGMVAYGNGTGCAFRNSEALGCGPAVGPATLRLGGGQGAQSFPAAFGNGWIAELVAYSRALSNSEVRRAAKYFTKRYGTN